MLATTPLFYAYDWPRRALSYIIRSKTRDNSTPPQSDIAAAAANDEDVGVDDIADDASRNTPATNKADKVYRQNESSYSLKLLITVILN